MISFLTIYKNALELRPKITLDFFNHMNDHIYKRNSIELLICDYGSTDDTVEILKEYPYITHVKVEPNEGEFLNMAKCLNAGCFVAKNPIIAPFGVDMRVDLKSIDRLFNMFYSMGDIIVRPPMAKWDEDNRLIDITNTPYLVLKDTVLQIGGWDERMVGWGKEDDDLMERILKYGNNVMELRIRAGGFGYGHLWHPTDFMDENDYDDSPNIKIFRENRDNNGKNLVNSYWIRQD